MCGGFGPIFFSFFFLDFLFFYLFNLSRSRIEKADFMPAFKLRLSRIQSRTFLMRAVVLQRCGDFRSVLFYHRGWLSAMETPRSFHAGFSLFFFKMRRYWPSGFCVLQKAMLR